jgi:hypothetical protein
MNGSAPRRISETLFILVSYAVVGFGLTVDMVGYGWVLRMVGGGVDAMAGMMGDGKEVHGPRYHTRSARGPRDILARNKTSVHLPPRAMRIFLVVGRRS